MKRCILLGAAPTSDAEPLKKYIQPDDFIIAADGGIRLAEKLDILPHLMVADHDSSAPVEGVKAISLPVEKDVTDTAAAMQLAYDRGYRDFALLGCLGGRLDHTIACLITSRRFAEHGCRVLLADSKHELTVLLPGVYRLPEGDRHLSFFALSEYVKVLTLTGVKYPLNQYLLKNDDPLCVSNRVTEGDAAVSFDAGVLLQVFSED